MFQTPIVMIRERIYYKKEFLKLQSFYDSKIYLFIEKNFFYSKAASIFKKFKISGIQIRVLV